MFALYTTSTVIGACLVAAAFAGSVLTLPLLIFAAVIGAVINYFKGREAYDWLEQCFFGIKPNDERFERLDEDRKAFLAIFS
jgi:membrane protein DedA with SNARE-associated domain